MAIASRRLGSPIPLAHEVDQVGRWRHLQFEAQDEAAHSLDGWPIDVRDGVLAP
jgi:hypothetical protein